MKKIILFFIFILFLSSCMQNGSDGLVYIAYTWDWYVDSLTDNNLDTPSTITESEYYRTSAGTYDLTYYCSDLSGNEWYWDCYYILIQDEGKPGSLFADGADGVINYYKFNMYGLVEPTLTLQKPNKEKKIYLENREKIESNDFYPSGKIIIDTSYVNDLIVIVERQKYIKIK